MILSLGWSCAGTEPVLQGCGRICPSPCRVCSSAYVESVLQRVVRHFLRRVLRQFFAIFPHQLTHLRSGLIQCCFPPSSLQIGPSRRKVGRQTQNWFFTNLFGSAACLAQHLRNLLC